MMTRLLLSLVFILSILPTQAQSLQSINDTDGKWKGEKKRQWYHLTYRKAKAYGVGSNAAYDDLLADKKPKRKVVVGIIDSGVDTEHEDLKDQIWTNIDEVPGNGKDDDQNGYVDDVHGWNFLVDPDGNDVIYDNLEATRVLRTAKQLERVEKPYPDWLTKETMEHAAKIYNKNSSEMEGLSQFGAVYAKADSTVKAVTGKEEYTYDDVKQMKGDTDEIKKAKKIFFIFRSLNIDKDELEEMGQMSNKYNEYWLNFDFDPRSNLKEGMVYYGNNSYGGEHAGHGTHVAGIVAAGRNNEYSANGIASDVVEIMVLRAVPDGDERDIDVANAIRYAVDNGANIINMSFGKGLSPHKQLVEEALEYAAKNNVLVVHAAGNDSENNDDVQNYPNANALSNEAKSSYVTVGALAPSKKKKMIASFSNYGQGSVDIFAPGEDIWSTLPSNKYGFRSGTSMAAPVFTGVAALVWAYNPDLSSAELKTLLMETGYDLEGKKVNVPGRDEPEPFENIAINAKALNAYDALYKAMNE